MITLSMTSVMLLAYIAALFYPRAVKRRAWYLRGWIVLLLWLIIRWLILLLVEPTNLTWSWGLSIFAILPLGLFIMACYPKVKKETIEEAKILVLLEKCKVLRQGSGERAKPIDDTFDEGDSEDRPQFPKPITPL